MAKHRLINTQSSITNEPESKDKDLSILKGLLNEEYVLIIGSEAILDKDVQSNAQGTGDTMFQIYNAIADGLFLPREEQHIVVSKENRPLTDHVWQVLLSERAINTQSICRKAYLEFRDPDSVDVDDSLDELLSGLKKLHIHPTIFTTCIDDTLERCMKCFWDELDVYNFKKQGEIKRYLDYATLQKRNKNSKKTSVVYLFGKIDDRDVLGHSVDFVFTEDEALETISKYIKAEDQGLGELLRKHFFTKKILSIGCHFDDWRFRFFWYAFRGNIPQLKEGTVAYTCDGDDSLLEYLRKKEVNVENDSRLFMNRLVALMNEDAIKQKVLSDRLAAPNAVFISYASEDFTLAYQLFRFLHDEGKINVWLDFNNLSEGMVYPEVIRESIQTCGVFLPILSDAVKKSIENGNTKRYFVSEWETAKKNGKIVVPVTAGTYNPREEYHELFKSLVGISDKKDITIDNIGKREVILNAVKEKLSIFEQ